MANINFISIYFDNRMRNVEFVGKTKTLILCKVKQTYMHSKYINAMTAYKEQNAITVCLERAAVLDSMQLSK
jgi:hypothetical protein